MKFRAKPIKRFFRKLKDENREDKESEDIGSPLEETIKEMSLSEAEGSEEKGYVKPEKENFEVNYIATKSSEEGDIEVDLPFFFEPEHHNEFTAPEAGGKIVEHTEWDSKIPEPGKTYEPKATPEEVNLFKEAPYIPKEDARGELRKKTEGKGVVDKRHEFY